MWNFAPSCPLFRVRNPRAARLGTAEQAEWAVTCGASVESDSNNEMNHLRSQARRLGLSIRTRRASRASGVRTFALVDRETGHVIETNLEDLSDVQTHLGWIVRQRRMALPLDDVPAEPCPACGTLRVAFFRWCLSCGLDYEANREPTLHMPRRPRWSGPGGRLFGRPLPEPRAILDRTPGRPSIVSRVVTRAYEVNDRFAFGLTRQLAGGAVVALVVGAMVVLLVQATR